jgi:hypothetical protein
MGGIKGVVSFQRIGVKLGLFVIGIKGFSEFGIGCDVLVKKDRFLQKQKEKH